MKITICIVTLAVALMSCTAIFAQQKSAAEPCFRAMVKPQGWEVPKRGKALSRNAFVGLTNHPAIAHLYETSYRTPPDVWLPWYYVEDGRLMLYSFQFQLSSVFRFDVDGKPFRYIASVAGKDVGFSSTASWTDRDGDGVFEEFAWTGQPYDDLPEWVLKGSNHCNGTK